MGYAGAIRQTDAAYRQVPVFDNYSISATTTDTWNRNLCSLSNCNGPNNYSMKLGCHYIIDIDRGIQYLSTHSVCPTRQKSGTS